MKGTITHINKARGFAFIQDEKGLARFAHVSVFRRQLDFDFLSKNDRVDFVPADTGDKGPRAVDVVKEDV